MTLLNDLGKPLLIGLAIREVLAPLTGHPFDFEIWVRLGVFIQSGMTPYSLLPYVPHLSISPSSVITSISYPPLPAFIFGATYAFYELLGSQSALLYYFLLKQPMVISDLLVAVFLFKLVSLRQEPARARRVALLWIFLPFAIIVSSMWGALDPIALLLILASLYAIQTGRPNLSAGLLGLATYLKLMPLIFLPLFLIGSGFSTSKRAAMTVISLGIPLLGTLVPFFLLGWNLSGIDSAVSYQALLPSFGGMGIFNALSLVGSGDGALAELLGLVWIAALLTAYASAYTKKTGITESLLVTVLLFSIFRPVMPEQWALYPIAFLLIEGGGENRTHMLALTAVATAYLLTNNFLLVRFFSPVSPAALAWDQFVDNASAISEVRYALLFALSTLFSAEALSVAVRKQSFLASKLKVLRGVGPRAVLLPLAYLGIVSLGGGLLDFTVTSMITDWALALQSRVFLGLSWLSLYHIMLVAVFETVVILIVLFARRNLSESTGLFLLLTFLNFVASSFALITFRILGGSPILATTDIYLISSVSVTERAFIVFATALGVLGILYLNEIRYVLLLVLRRIAQTAFKGRWGPGHENSLPAPS